MSILKWLADLLFSVVDTIVSIFAFLGNMIYSFFLILRQIPTLISTLTTAIGFLPSQYIAPLTLTLTIAVVFFILNKER